MLQFPGISTAAFDGPGGASEKRLVAAAAEFEALLIAQMLKSTRSDNHLSPDEGEGADSGIADLANQQFSTLLAASGGLGLASFAGRSLGQQSAKASN